MKDVKTAYRKLALRFHPDKNMFDGDGKEFKTITEAYQILRAYYKREFTSNPSTHDSKENDKKYDFNKKRYSWGARSSDRTPTEDWTKYTRYTDNAYRDFWKYYEKTFWQYYEKIRAETREATEPVQAEHDIPVSVDVDPGRCIACCSCELIAPAVFRVERNVQVNPKSRVINSQGARSEKILDAAQTCPTKAISVTDKVSCRRLYPW